MSEKHCTEYYNNLYSIQDEVLKIVDGSEFYLTGGTALSRFYLEHRYSDDLDFFVHQKTDFLQDVKRIIAHIKSKFISETRVLTSDFAQIYVYPEEFHEKYKDSFGGKLKVDFVNEQEIPRFGELKPFDVFSRVDNLRNILSNKLTALTRLEPKDVADIWQICKKLAFKWEQIIFEADQKEAIEELMVFDLLETFPTRMFGNIKWIKTINPNDFEKDRKVILEDLVAKGANSLAMK